MQDVEKRDSMSTAKHRAVLSIGSNIDPERHFKQCSDILQQETTLLGEATVIQTAPDGYQAQPDFLNGACYLETGLPYNEFNAYLKAVEKRLGRVKGPIKSGPRTIDLDIILWDGEVVHDDYYHKQYVIGPVNELVERYNITIISDLPPPKRQNP